MAKNQKTEYFGIRITRDQAKAIRKLAKNARMGVSEWVRDTFDNRIIALSDSAIRANKEAK